MSWEPTEAELVEWGETIGREATTPLVLALRGDLGAGKTTLARSIARGAGVTGHIPSPTYNLLFRYAASASRHVVHLDLYRLDTEDDVWALGWADLPAEDEIVVIEWPERAERLLPVPRWEIMLMETDRSGARSVRVERVGAAPSIPRPEGT